MITKWFKNVMKCALVGWGWESDDTPPGSSRYYTFPLQIKAVDNGNMYYISRPDFPRDADRNFRTNASDNGFRIGSGTTPPTEDDYQMESMITSNFDTGQQRYIYKSTINGKPAVTHRLIVKNTGSSNLIVSEVGSYQRCWCAEFLGKSSSGWQGYKTYLVDRTVLDNPVTIPPGDLAAIDYTIITDFNV